MTRFVFYSHDSYGLGHFRRCALLAGGLVGHDQHHEVLIVTGSPRAQSFRLPERVDTVKIPSATKNGAGGYQPRKLRGPIDDLITIRSELISSTVLSYRPDVILVDHAPLGLGAELAPTFDAIDRLGDRPHLVLGLRDIVDDASRVEADWTRDAIWPALQAYDEVLVYGDADITTTATELDLGQRVGRPVTHTGYVAPAMPEPVTDEPFLLVTPGGGGDGQLLLRRFLDTVAQGATAGIRSLVVTGPLLSPARRAELLVRAESLPSVTVIEFSDRMRSLISSATGVISMGGYNTVVEELAAGTPAMVVPRQHPRLEQTVRARRLAARGLVDHCPLEGLDADRVAGFVAQARATGPMRFGGNRGGRDFRSVDLAGVATTVSALSGCTTTTPEVSAHA